MSAKLHGGVDLDVEWRRLRFFDVAFGARRGRIKGEGIGGGGRPELESYINVLWFMARRRGNFSVAR